jgi:putative transposase
MLLFFYNYSHPESDEICSATLAAISLDPRLLDQLSRAGRDRIPSSLHRVLREKLGKKRILLNDDQRRRLAVKGKILGRKMLKQMATIVTPDTILRWHRELVAAKWDYSQCRNKIGRPPASAEVIELVLRMARENPGWGYDHIQGALANLGHLISNTCIAGIMKAHGIDPAPDRKQQSTWKSFLQAH